MKTYSRLRGRVEYDPSRRVWIVWGDGCYLGAIIVAKGRREAEQKAVPIIAEMRRKRAEWLREHWPPTLTLARKWFADDLAAGQMTARRRYQVDGADGEWAKKIHRRLRLRHFAGLRKPKLEQLIAALGLPTAWRVEHKRQGKGRYKLVVVSDQHEGMPLRMAMRRAGIPTPAGMEAIEAELLSQLA